MHDPDGHQAVDRFERVDRVAAGDRDAGLRAYRLAAGDDALDHLDRHFLERHSHDRQCEDRLAAHRVYVRERVGRGDAPEVVRVVDDGREEIGGGDDRLLVVQPVHGRVVARLDPH